MKAVHFGAGNIGKGLIGMLLSQSGFELTYIDADQKGVDSINQNNGFTVQIIGEDDCTINNVTAFHVSKAQQIQQSLLDADLITTSVGANNVVHIAPTILKALLERSTPIDIIANENMINASTALKNEIYALANDEEKVKLEQVAVFSNSAIDRLALSNEKGTIVEPYAEWVIQDTNIFSLLVKNIKGATYTNDMVRYIERKLFCVNANHASSAYLGYQKGYNYVYEAFQDQEIVDTIKKMHEEIMAYFVEKYQFDLVKHRRFIEKTMKRHGNILLKDDITRVGASPLRKLGITERLVAPFLQLSERDLPRTNLAKVIASALKFDPKDDLEAREIQQRGYVDILSNHCQLNQVDKDLILSY